MKVLLLTTHLNTGGIGMYTVNLARYLRKAGVDVTVVSGGGDLESTLEYDGIASVTIDLRTKFEFGLKMWKAVPSLIKIVKDGGFDLVHAQTRVTQVLGRLLEANTAVPLVTTCHGFYKHQRSGRRFFPCWGRKVIAISRSVQRHLLEDFHLPDDRVELVYNGIEVGPYADLQDNAKDGNLMNRIGLPGDALLAGTISRLAPVKGHKYLISAFKKAVERYPDMRLLIVGEGAEEDLLRRQVRQLGIAGKVFFIHGNDAPAKKYLFLMDIFCLPSISEGLGLSLMEAMAAGRPCIATDIGGPAELITREKDGILVPPKDPAALSDELLRLAENGEFRRQLGEAAHLKAISNFSIEDSAAKTVKVYEEVLGSRL